MSKRTVYHKKETVRAYEPIPSKEYREILDHYLGGESYFKIAQMGGREEAAVKLLITSKIPMNYDEDGKRKSVLERLRESPSSLSPDRKPKVREIRYYKKLKRRGRNMSECSEILNLKINTLEELEREYGLPQQKGGFW